MSPPPVERTSMESPGRGGDATATRSLPTPFYTKTYQHVDDKAIDDVILGNEDGSTFIVWNPTELQRIYSPSISNTIISQVLSVSSTPMKVVPDRWEFSNDCFCRDEKHMLVDIQRRKIDAAAQSAQPPAPAAALVPPPAVTVATVLSPSLRTSVSPCDLGEEQALSSNSSRGVGEGRLETARSLTIEVVG